jgi:RimJ/RimL family protein N-acetyltransferase
MTLQPILHGTRVSLRPLVPDDWAALYAVAADPLIWEVHPAHDRWQEPVFRRFFADALESGGALVAYDPTTNAVIGSSRYDPRRAEPGEIEIGWTFLARSHWGGATNAEMKRLMIAHALEHYTQTIFLVGETNLRSRRAMEKIGGKLLNRTSTYEMAGSPVQHVVYAIDRAAFEAGPLVNPSTTA